MNSKFLNLNWKDVLKGFVVAVFMTILTSIYTGIQTNQFPVTREQWKVILITSLGAGIAYLLKNVLSNSDGEIFKKDK
jgi:hypothetical protein